MNKLVSILTAIISLILPISMGKFFKIPRRYNFSIGRNLPVFLVITLLTLGINKSYCQCSGGSTELVSYGSFDATSNGTNYSTYTDAVQNQVGPPSADINPPAGLCWMDRTGALYGACGGACSDGCDKGYYTIADKDDYYNDWATANSSSTHDGNMLLVNTDGPAGTYAIFNNTIATCASKSYTLSVDYAQLNKYGTTTRSISLQYSLDGGTTWLTCGTDDMANKCLTCGAGSTNTNPGWQTMSCSFNSGTATSVKIRTIIQTDGSSRNDWAFDNFSFAGPSPGTLPITFEYLKAVQTNESVILDWKTSSEKNSGYFEVQRSSDGLNFYSIGSIPSGNNSNGATYEFIDSDLPEGVAYYRLKQVDIDGSITYTAVVTNSNLSDEPYLKVIPNVVEKDDKVKLFIKNLTSITIYDALGRTYASENISIEEHQRELKLDSLPAGLYFIKGTTSHRTILTEKFILK